MCIRQVIGSELGEQDGLLERRSYGSASKRQMSVRTGAHAAYTGKPAIPDGTLGQQRGFLAMRRDK